MTRSERTLWRRWLERRDGDAFAGLVRRHARFVFDFARRVAGNRADAEDLTQEAFLKLAESEPDGPERVGLRAFLGRRVVLGARMLKRAALARRRHESRAPAPTRGEDPEDVTRREQAHAALALLGRVERRAVELRFLHDLPYAEIAHVLGLSEEAARMRVHRGLERLRARLGRDASVVLAALPLHRPPAPLVSSMAKTALMTAGGVAMQVGGKKLAAVVVIALLIGGAGAWTLHSDDARPPPRAPRHVVGATDPAPVVRESDEPDAAPLPSSPVIAGVVADEDGAPVAGALVRVVRYDRRDEPLEARTDESGSFTVDRVQTTSRCFVEARHAEYARAVEHAAVGQRVRLVLRPGAAVRVQVRADGDPVSGAHVVAVQRGQAWSLGGPGERGVADGVTDGRGETALRVAPGTYEVWADAPDRAPRLSDPVVCAIGTPQSVSLDLEAGGHVFGAVRDGAGRPLAGARVVVKARPGFRADVRTDPEGRYALRNVPLGSAYWLQVVADHPDHAAAHAARMWNAGDGDRMRFDLVLPAGARVRGLVVDGRGRPLAGRRVVLDYTRSFFWMLYGSGGASNANWPFGATTDEEGRVELERLPPGDALLHLAGDRKAKVDVTLRDGRTHDIELRVEEHVLRGRVVDARGEPVADAHVRPGRGRTDADGRFALTLHTRERMDLVVTAPDHAPYHHAAEPGAEIEIRLPEAALAGTVTRPDGRPIHDARVTVWLTVNDSGHSSSTGTDSRGHFRFRVAADESYRASATAEGLEPSESQTIRGARDDVGFVLATPAEAERRRVRGVVVDAGTGAPVEATVLYWVAGTRRRQVAEKRADTPGGFVCRSLEPTDDVRLVFSADGYLPSDPIRVSYDGRTPIEPLIVRLRRGGEVEVFVREDDGTAVPGAAIFLYAGPVQVVRTDPEGRCLVLGIPSGRRRVTASHPYLARLKSQEVDVAATARTRVEFRGRPAGRVGIRLPRGVRPKQSFVAVLRDGAGEVVTERRLDHSHLAQIDGLRAQRWQWEMVVTEAGTYRLECEMDGKALPARTVEVALRETVTVDLDG